MYYEGEGRVCYGLAYIWGKRGKSIAIRKSYIWRMVADLIMRIGFHSCD